jgi:hypothetical protein
LTSDQLGGLLDGDTRGWDFADDLEAMGVL